MCLPCGTGHSQHPLPLIKRAHAAAGRSWEAAAGLIPLDFQIANYKLHHGGPRSWTHPQSKR